MTLPVEEFIELVTEKIAALISHSYISKIQSTYLKTRKENLKDDECLILIDFAENYNFVPQNENLIKGAENSAILQYLEPSLHNYFVCVYEENSWIELVSELNKEVDYTIAFMHPYGPSETFYWPERQDECHVPSQNILFVIETPGKTSHIGRLYKIGATSKKKIDVSWNTFKESC
ncbi:hypothetical protein AVEN_94825-1 [Araneus ventricosus]|uniref:Uncharacterized protein n=1 Tax=Araneus ventricosus TaxID=182803 RepID=A0A4Y2CMB5_ARAVE|nr:hypothetical protein AVEN_94825-1 [Araneus ventricosus]